MNKINLPLATTSWDEKEIEAIQKVVQSGFYTMGTEVARYEADFAKYFGSKYSLMCSSGSTANLLMVAALFFRKENPLRRGDEVLVPAVSWSTTYYPLAQYGLKLKFVDIDLETLNYDLKALESAFSPKTKLVMAVNLLGNPNDFEQLQSLCQRHGAILIEDNCESMGARFLDRECGTFGVMGTFSSFFSHHISTMEGGSILTDDEELYHILLCLRAHGWTRNLPKFNKVTGEKSDDAFEESFKFVLPGYNVRPLEMEGAIGQEQLKKLPHFVNERRRNAEVFVREFAGHPDLIIQKEMGQSSWFGFSLVLRPNARWLRKDLVRLLSSAGVDCRPIVAGNFAKNDVLKWMEHEIHGELKNAEWIDQHGLFIGNHHHPIDDKIRSLKKLLTD
ncbi:MAG: DegT/DnrJ/EryC1/StrS family aminotransferase [Bdellovibrionaceae bacterium]|nr:DegT/DnrJ/EryC1/StrS family aminotransferase [Pseudobdellovibrionaceae bacterium]